MRVLLTGCAGFIGFHVAKKLLNSGIDVYGIDNLNDYYDVELKYSRLRELGVGDEKYSQLTIGKFSFVNDDLNNLNLWQEIPSPSSFEFVIHLAAQAGVRYSLEDPLRYIDSNIRGFQIILDYLKNSSCKLIYASSSSVYGNSDIIPFNESDACNNPLSVYAMTKRTNELMAVTYDGLFGLKAVGLRFFTVYGPYGRPDMAPYIFTDAAFTGKEVRVFNYGNQYRDFTHVQDVIDGIMSIVYSNNFISGVYNLGNGSPVSLAYFCDLIELYTKRTLKKSFKEAQLGDSSYTYADITKFRRDYSFEPKIKIEEGLADFVNWYKSYVKI